MTMSQTLTKPAWPEATTCVTAVGWKYHSTIPLPLLYFGMTKRQYSGRAQNHKTSEASHIMALHFLTSASPPSATFFHPCFCQKPMIKCTHLDLYSSFVPWRRFHFTPPPVLSTPSSISLSPSMGHQVNICIFSPRRSDIQTSQLFENGIWQEVVRRSKAVRRAH